MTGTATMAHFRPNLPVQVLLILAQCCPQNVLISVIHRPPEEHISSLLHHGHH
jgi:hypothetical protein